MTQIRIPSLKLSNILDEIQDGILFKLFGSEYINVKTLLSTIAQVTCSDGYEFELRFIDNKGHTSPQLWHDFQCRQSLLELVSYADDIVYTYMPAAPLVGIHFRSYEKSHIYERKTMISSVSSRSEISSIIPLKINLNKESLMPPNKDLSRYDNIQRRQRCSYHFKSSLDSHYLSNWRVDKTIRLYATTLNDKKLSLPLDMSNIDTLTYYDELDIEFEYIGDFSEIVVSFFELIRTIYTPYEYFDIEYLIIKHMLDQVIPQKFQTLMQDNIISLIPLPLMMTNDILQVSSIKDYLITNKYTGDHGLIICFGTPESYAIYSLTKNKLSKICGTLVLLDIGKHNSNKPHTIESIIRSFVENEHNDALPTIHIFESMIQDEPKHSFVLTDVLIYSDALVESEPLLERRKIMSEFISSFGLSNDDASFDVSHIVKAVTWSDVLEKRNKSFIAKPLTGSLLDSKSYKITFHEQITINFKVQYVPLKRLFYLYVIGNPTQVIMAKTLNNKYSVDHFGYSLISGNVPTTDKYLLYVSPYVKESYVLRPSFSSSNPILRDMYENHIKYNGAIIKMTRADDSSATWIPISVLNTHEPETYINALKLESLIFDHLHVSTYSPNKQLIPFKDIYNSIYETLDQYTIERMFIDSNAESILDIVNDVGGNVSLIYNLSSVKYIYALSNNRHTLTRYIEQATDRTFNSHIFIDGTKTRSANKQFSIEAVFSSLELNSALRSLNQKWSYTPKSIDIVYFEDDYTQIKSLIDIINFRRLCDSILSPNGKIVFKTFDGSKVNDFISKQQSIPSITTNQRRKRFHTVQKLPLEYVNENNLLQYVVNTKSISKLLTELTSKTKIASNAETNTITTAKGEIQIPKMYNIAATNKEQINSLAVVFSSIDRTDDSILSIYRYMDSLINVSNLCKIFGIDTEMFVNSYSRMLPHFYSPNHQYDKLTGSIGDSNDVIKRNAVLACSLLIRKSELSADELNWLIDTRISTPYTTAIITRSVLDILPCFNISDETNPYHLYIIFPSFVTSDDKSILMRYIETHVLNPNSEPIFRIYSHPKLSSTYSQRITFNLDFLDLLFEKFKRVNVSTPLTQNEIASYIATDRQFGAFESVEHYLNAYTVITAERM